MRSLSIAVTLGLLLVAVWAHRLPSVSRPPCDSPDVEAAAMVAQDYLNAQHTHGYKYVLNRIEDVKIISTPSGEATYLVEVDLLETNCHVLDPTPLANCSVRPKMLTAIEGDCDVVLKKVGGALSVTAFKCKTEESREDLCIGCPTLLPLNHTSGLDFVHASLGTFNGRINNTFRLIEVGRISSQLVSGGSIFAAEYVIIEANCTGSDCVPLDNAERGFCVARGLDSDHTVDCSMLGVLPTNVHEVNGTAASSPSLLPVIHAMHGLKHHKLTRIHNPELSGLLSAESPESAESGEVVQVMQVALGPSVVGVDVPVTAAEDLPTAGPVLSVDVPAAEDLPTPGPVLSVDVPAAEDLPTPGPVLSVDVPAAEDLPTADPVLSVDVPAAEDLPTADPVLSVEAGDDSTKAVVVKRAAESLEPIIFDTELAPLLVQQCPGRIRHY